MTHWRDEPLVIGGGVMYVESYSPGIAIEFAT